MENNFDKHIKKLLEDFEVDYQPSDWDLMEEKIDLQEKINPEVEDVYLDGKAYDSLHNIKVPYEPAHWEVMNQRLNDRYALRSRLMRYKVAEIALVILFIITLAQYLPYTKSKKIATNTIELKQAQNGITNESVTAENNLSAESSVNLSQEAEKSETINPEPVQENIIFYNTPPAEVQNNDPLYTPPVVATIETAQKGTTLDDKKTTQEDASLSSTSPANTGTTINIEDELSPDALAFNTALIDPVDLKNAGTLTIQGVEELSGAKVFSDLKQPINVRIGMAIGPDANYIMTPSNERQGWDVFNQYALGYSGGFTLGFQYGNWEVETGALYSYVRYGSRNVFEVKGSFAEGGYVQQGLVGSELDLIRIPVSLKYNFIEKGKWNFYVFSGISANTSVETFYNYTTQDLGRSSASRNFPAPSTSSERDPDFSPVETFDGFFEGGKLSDNLFFTGNLGFGVERYFTPRMSIFVQPSYLHQFSEGLGPQNDQINSVSILTGAKVTLKKQKKAKRH